MPDYEGPYSPEYYELPYRDEDYQPWWYDWGIEAIRRGAETAQVIGSGWPTYPTYPTPVPAPPPVPPPSPGPGVAPQPPGQGIQLSTTTLMLIVGGFLLFTLGKRGR